GIWVNSKESSPSQSIFVEAERLDICPRESLLLRSSAVRFIPLKVGIVPPIGVLNVYKYFNFVRPLIIDGKSPDSWGQLKTLNASKSVRVFKFATTPAKSELSRY